MRDGRIKVGDWVVGNSKASRYAVTRPGTLWKVVEVSEIDDDEGDGDISIEAIEGSVRNSFLVRSTCFDIYNESFLALQENMTGYFRFEHTGSKGNGTWEFIGKILTISDSIPTRNFTFRIIKPLNVPQSALDYPDKPVVLSERKLVETRAELKEVDLLEYLMKGE